MRSHRAPPLKLLRFEDTETLRFEDKSLDGHHTLWILSEHGTWMMVRQPLGLYLSDIDDPSSDQTHLVFRDLYS